MRIFTRILMVFLTMGAFQLIAQTTYYSKAAATDFNSVASWGTNPNGSGTAPASISAANNFVIQNGSNMTLNSSADVRQLTINGVGTLNVAANTLTVAITGQNNSELVVTSGGALNFTGGTINVNGGTYFADGAAFNQTGGELIVDGNSGVLATSIDPTSVGSVIFGIGYSSGSSSSSISTVANAAKFTLTGGKITIVDPSLSTSTASYAWGYRATTGCHVNASTSHTVQFGNGVSTQAGGHTNGFYVYNYVGTGYLTWGNVRVDAGTGTNRFVKTLSSIGISGNLEIVSGEYQLASITYLSGNLINNGTLTTTSSLYFGRWLNAVASAALNPQTISGSGSYRNLVSPSVSTANFASLYFNNISTGGVTFADANSLLSGANTGTVSSVMGFTACPGGVNLSGGTFVQGVSTTAAGSTSFTNGGFRNGSLKKWLTTTTLPTTLPSTTTGLWPFVANGANRNLQIAASTAVSTAGSITVAHADVAGLATVTLSDAGTAVEKQTNSAWAVSTSGLTGGTYLLNLSGEGLLALNAAPGVQPRLMQGAGFIGTHALATGTLSAPVANRTGIAAANFLGTQIYSIGASDASLGVTSIATGDWNQPTTWSNNAVPTNATDVIIQSGHVVTVNSTANVAKSITMNGNSVLTIASGDLTVTGATASATPTVVTTSAASVINVNSGTLNIGTAADANAFSRITVNGTLNVSGGVTNIFGNLDFPSTTSVFNQTGGTINIDGNKGGVAANSVQTTINLVNIVTSNVTLSGGNMVIADPHAAVGASYAFWYSGSLAINNTAGWTLQLGLAGGADAGGAGTYPGMAVYNSGGKIYFDNLIVDAGVTGTNRFANFANLSFGFKNVLVTSNGELRLSTTMYSGGDITVNSGGILTTLSTLVFSDYKTATLTPSTTAQTVSGAGTFRNLAATPTACFTGLTVNNTSAAGVTFLGNSLTSSGTGTVSGTLTFTNGKINTSGGVFTLGVSGTVPGSLSWTSGGFTSGSPFKRWVLASIATMPSVAGQFPFLSNSNDNRTAWYGSTAAPTAGWLQMTHNDVAGTSNVSFADGGITVGKRSNSNWAVSTGGGFATATGTFRLRADNALSIANFTETRIVAAAAAAAGTTGLGTGSTSAPEGNKTVLATANYTGTFYAGTSDVVSSVTSGNWSDGSTWSSGSVPVCGQSVVINAGHNVTVVATSVGGNTQINAGGTLTVSGGDLSIGCPTVNDASLTNTGTIEVSGGVLNVNGNINNLSTSTFIQAGGTITIDGNGTNFVAKPGTITNTAASTAVTGAGTSFLTDVPVGTILTNSSGTILGTVTSVTSNTALVVSPAITAANTAIAFGTQSSVKSGTPIFWSQTANTYLTGGTMIIVDPHASTSTTDDAFRYSNTASVNITSANHILQLGNGVSTQAGGNATNGFVVETYASSGRLNLGSMVINTTSTGTTNNRFVSHRYAHGFNGNITVTSGRYLASTVVAVAGNVTNNAEMINTGTLVFGLPNGISYLQNTAAQTVDGTGTFSNNIALASSTANFTNITVNNANPGVTFANANTLLSGTSTGTVSGTLAFTSGLVNTGANTLILGVSAASTGTLSYTSGGFASGSTFARWFGTAIGGATITAATTPTHGTGSFPFASVKTASPLVLNAKGVFLNQTAVATAGGKIAVKYTETAGTSMATITDGTYAIDTRSNDNWQVTPTGITGTPTYSMAISGESLYVPQNGNSRITLAAGMTTSSTHQNGTILPNAQRTAMSLADLSNTFYLGVASADIPNNATATGNWYDASIWSKGTVPSACEAVVIKTPNIVTCNVPAACSNLTIEGGAEFIHADRTLTIGCVNKNNKVQVNGKYTMNGSTTKLIVNGSFAVGITTGTFIQNAGDIIVDANDVGATATSATSHLFDAYVNTATSFQLNGGTITIVDPPVSSDATKMAFKLYPNAAGIYAVANPNHTLILGDGVSTDPTTNTSGFGVYTYGVSSYYALGSVIVNGTPDALTTANRYGYTYGLTPILGDLTVNNTNGEMRCVSTTYLKGNLTVNIGARLVSTSTFGFGDYVGGIFNVSSAPQIVSGAGTFANNTVPASSTGNFYSHTFNNTGGVTFFNNVQVSYSTTFSAGVVNIASPLAYTLGVNSSSFNYVYTPSNQSYVNGTFKRYFASSRTGTVGGSYTTTTILPVGNGATNYMPIWVDPTTNASGYVLFSATAFNANAGTAGAGVSNLSATNRWEVSVDAPANLTNTYIGAAATGIAATSALVASTSAAGSYEGMVGAGFAPLTGTANTPPAVKSTTPVTTANFNNHISFGDLVPCVGPTVVTGPAATQMGSTSFTGVFTAPTGTPAASGYLVVRYASAALETAPTVATNYALAAVIGAGTVVANGTATTFVQTGLTAGTTYDYYIYAYNNSACSGGPVYATGVKLTVATCASAPVTPATITMTGNTPSTLTYTWSASTTTGVNYEVDVCTDAAYTNFVAGYNALNNGTATTITVTGLTAFTQYYVRVRAVDPIGGCYSLNLTGANKTACNTTALPWVENFDSYTTVGSGTATFATAIIPPCWTNTAGSNYAFSMHNAAGNTQHDPKSAPNYLTVYYNTATAASTWTPTFNLTAGVSYDFSFAWIGDAYSGWNGDVWVNSLPSLTGATQLGAPFVVAATTAPKVYENKIYTFIPTTSGTYTFGIKVSSNTSPFYLGFDDMKVEPTPTCAGAIGGTSTISSSSSCGTANTANLKATGYSTGLGLTYQWEKSYDNFATTAIPVGTATSTYADISTGALQTGTNYFRLNVTCVPTSVVAYSTVVSTVYTNPTIATTSPGSRCGVGTVPLSATATNATHTLKWYNAPTGGIPIGTGNTFTTPVINSTTDFYVAASEAGGSTQVSNNGIPNVTTSTQNTGVIVDFNVDVTLNSINVYSTAAGTATVTVLNSALVNIYTSPAIPIVASTIGTPQTLNLGVNIPAGTGYRILVSNTGNALGYHTGVFPSPLGNGVGNIVNGATATSTTTLNYFVYGINTTSGCSGTRTAVNAAVVAPPALTLAPASAAICAGGSTTLNVSSNISSYDTYTWSPSTGVSGTAASGFTFNPSATTAYTLSAAQTSGALCVNNTTATITVNPVPGIPSIIETANVTPCAMGKKLDVSPGTPTIDVGTATTVSSGIITTPFSSGYEGARIQYLIPASELVALGLSSGAQLNSLSFNVTTQGAATTTLTEQKGYTVKLAPTTATALSGYVTPTGAYSTVFGPVNLQSPPVGAFNMPFATPYTWDGTSGILVEICHENDPTGTGGVMYATNSTVNYSTTSVNTVYGRYIDNSNGLCGSSTIGTLIVNGPNRPNMTWGVLPTLPTWSAAAGLYMDNAFATPYTAGTLTNTVYAKPTIATTYTATRTIASTGCSSSSSSTLIAAAQPNVVLTTAASATGNPLCITNSWDYYGIGMGVFFAVNWAPDGTLSAQNAAARAAATCSLSLDPSAPTSTLVGGNSIIAMRRYWNIIAPAYDEPVNLKFFYSQAEFDEINNNATYPNKQWFKTVGTPYSPGASMSNGTILSSIPLTVSATGVENGIPYSQFDGIVSFSGGTFAAGTAYSPLPIVLKSFTAAERGNVNEIKWETELEQNLRAFVVEKSSDAKNWTSLTQVLPNANKTYATIDNNPFVTTYYRLKSIDKDGSSDLTEIVVVNRKTGKFTLTNVSPNPTSDNVYVKFETAENTEVTISVIDIFGKLMSAQKVNATTGFNAAQVDMSAMPSAPYFLNINDGVNTITQRIIKQ